jgi:type VI protein secretion system component VasF
MKDNIKKMVDSIEDTSKLEQSAEALREESLSYKKTAIEIRRLTFWQNMKLWFILGGVILLLIALILFLIF